MHLNLHGQIVAKLPYPIEGWFMRMVLHTEYAPSCRSQRTHPLADATIPDASAQDLQDFQLDEMRRVDRNKIALQSCCLSLACRRRTEHPFRLRPNPVELHATDRVFQSLLKLLQDRSRDRQSLERQAGSQTPVQGLENAADPNCGLHEAGKKTFTIHDKSSSGHEPGSC